MQGQIESALAAVGLEGLAERTVGSLSGGQLRRVMFARLFVQDAQVLLLDEPFVEVDEAAVADLMAVIQRWYQEGRVVMAVLHDLDEVRGGFPDALLLGREADRPRADRGSADGRKCRAGPALLPGVQRPGTGMRAREDGGPDVRKP